MKEIKLNFDVFIIWCLVSKKAHGITILSHFSYVAQQISVQYLLRKQWKGSKLDHDAYTNGNVL